MIENFSETVPEFSGSNHSQIDNDSPQTADDAFVTKVKALKEKIQNYEFTCAPPIKANQKDQDTISIKSTTDKVLKNEIFEILKDKNFSSDIKNFLKFYGNLLNNYIAKKYEVDLRYLLQDHLSLKRINEIFKGTSFLAKKLPKTRIREKKGENDPKKPPKDGIPISSKSIIGWFVECTENCELQEIKNSGVRQSFSKQLYLMILKKLKAVIKELKKIDDWETLELNSVWP